MAQCVKHLLCQYEWQLASVTTTSSTTKGQRQADLRSLPVSLGDPVSSRFNTKPCLRKWDEEQRGFFLQWLGTDTEITSNPSTGLKELFRRGGRKIVRATNGGWLQGNSAFQTRWDWYLCELPETKVAYTDLWFQTRQNPGIGESICIWSPLGKGKLVSSSGLSLVYQPHSRAGSIPRIVGQHKTDSTFCVYVLVCYFLTYWFLLS